MGLMHVGVGEGPEIIQMFGRGVRLKGWNMSLKRHQSSGAPIPSDSENLSDLEKLYIFGFASQLHSNVSRSPGNGRNANRTGNIQSPCNLEFFENKEAPNS